MGVNSFKPHILLLPEDDANRQLAVGFALEINSRQVQVLNEAGGWLHVCDRFENDYVQSMINNPQRSIVLLIDFDNDPKRRRHVETRVPPDMVSRVFAVGSWTDPEALRRDLSMTYEDIGRSIARECRAGERAVLSSRLLQHNVDDIDRICKFIETIY